MPDHPNFFQHVTAPAREGESGCNIMSELTGEMLNSPDAVARHNIALAAHLQAKAAAVQTAQPEEIADVKASVVKLGFSDEDIEMAGAEELAAMRNRQHAAMTKARELRLKRSNAVKAATAHHALCETQARLAWRTATQQRNELMQQWDVYVRHLHTAYNAARTAHANALAEAEQRLASKPAE